jgi:hypothetical protein
LFLAEPLLLRAVDYASRHNACSDLRAGASS